MDNRDRDNLNKNSGSNKGSDLNRNASSDLGRNKSDAKSDFGQKGGQTGQVNEPIGRSGKQGSSGMKNDKSGSNLEEKDAKGNTY